MQVTAVQERYDGLEKGLSRGSDHQGGKTQINVSPAPRGLAITYSHGDNITGHRRPNIAHVKQYKQHYLFILLYFNGLSNR